MTSLTETTVDIIHRSFYQGTLIYVGGLLEDENPHPICYYGVKIVCLNPFSLPYSEGRSPIFSWYRTQSKDVECETPLRQRYKLNGIPLRVHRVVPSVPLGLGDGLSLTPGVRLSDSLDSGQLSVHSPRLHNYLGGRCLESLPVSTPPVELTSKLSGNRSPWVDSEWVWTVGVFDTYHSQQNCSVV